MNKRKEFIYVLDLLKNMRCESVQRDAVTYSANISASILDKIWYVNIINGIRSLEVLDFRKCDFQAARFCE